MDNRPIGVFDSGLGGLTVVKSIRSILPNESIVYLGDTARVPYGTRSKETVTRFACDDIEFLLSHDVKFIVVACNTVASQACEVILKLSSVPLLSVVDAGVVEASGYNNVLVLATRGTVGSKAYEIKLLNSNNDTKVTTIACPLFVPLIEEGEIKGELIDLVISKYLKDISSLSFDAAILGCTHYPLIKDSLDSYFQYSLPLIDSSTAVAKMLQKKLSENDLLSEKRSKYSYYLTDITESFLSTAEVFLGSSIRHNVQKVDF